MDRLLRLDNLKVLYADILKYLVSKNKIHLIKENDENLIPEAHLNIRPGEELVERRVSIHNYRKRLHYLIKLMSIEYNQNSDSVIKEDDVDMFSRTWLNDDPRGFTMYFPEGSEEEAEVVDMFPSPLAPALASAEEPALASGPVRASRVPFDISHEPPSTPPHTSLFRTPTCVGPECVISGGKTKRRHRSIYYRRKKSGKYTNRKSLKMKKHKHI